MEKGRIHSQSSLALCGSAGSCSGGYRNLYPQIPAPPSAGANSWFEMAAGALGGRLGLRDNCYLPSLDLHQILPDQSEVG